MFPFVFVAVFGEMTNLNCIQSEINNDFWFNGNTREDVLHVSFHQEEEMPLKLLMHCSNYQSLRGDFFRSNSRLDLLPLPQTSGDHVISYPLKVAVI